MTSTTQNLSQSSMNIDDWLCRIRDLHDKDIDMGLARIGKVADIMHLRHLSAKVILIAGTNGKGTTSRFIEAYLLSMGHKVGLFNSPALLNYTETVRIDGQALDERQHTEAFAAIWQARGEVILTEFEFSTLAALYIFAQNDLDFVLMEVGMGGRLDSTNVVEPDISVLTTVALDHIGFLGGTREAIGFEKAGIFRSNKPAIVGELDIPASVYQQGKTIGAQLKCANEHYAYQLDVRSQRCTWQWQSESSCLSNLINPSIPRQNVATALACLQQLELPLNSARVNDVLANLHVEGRFESVLKHPQVILDVAHNLEAVGYMTERLSSIAKNRLIFAVVGMLKDKDIDGVIDLVNPLISRFYLCSLDTPRGAAIEQLTTCLEKRQTGPYSCYNCVADGLAAALEDVAKMPEEALIVVFGSFFTVAGAKQYLYQFTFKTEHAMKNHCIAISNHAED